MPPATSGRQDTLNQALTTTREPVDTEPSPPADMQPVPSGTAAPLELSSSAAAAPKDCLSNMPPELLSRVFVHSEYAEPISGPLLAYTRKYRSRDITITTVAKLRLFCDFMVSYPALGAYVDRLQLLVALEQEEDRSEAKLQTMYRSLRNVEELTVEGRLASLVLSHEVAATCFPRMQNLRLRHPCAGTRNPLAPERYRCLRHYPSLYHLEVTIDAYGDDSAIDEGEDKFKLWLDTRCPSNSDTESGRDSLDDSESHRPRSTPSPSNSPTGQSNVSETTSEAELRSESINVSSSSARGNIRVLRVTAPSCDPRTFEFIDGFECLYLLELVDESPESDFTSILNNLDYRAHAIEALALRDSGYRGNDPVAADRDISTSLKPFTRLHTLVLETSRSSSAIFEHLRDPLPLEHLEFSAPFTPISTTDLQALLVPGPARLSALKKLVVDVVDAGVIGTRVIDAGPHYDDYGVPGAHPDWELPEWSEGTFELEDAEDLVGIAKESGVEILGTVLEAIRVEDEWGFDNYCALQDDAENGRESSEEFGEESGEESGEEE